MGIIDSTHDLLDAVDAVGGERGMEGFGACFEGLDDPRTVNAGRHDLLELLMIALCTVLCGGQSAKLIALSQVRLNVVSNPG